MLMERLNNPFVIYGYKGTDYFCDRKKETKQIMQALLNERMSCIMSRSQTIKLLFCWPSHMKNQFLPFSRKTLSRVTACQRPAV